MPTISQPVGSFQLGPLRVQRQHRDELDSGHPSARALLERANTRWASLERNDKVEEVLALLESCPS